MNLPALFRSRKASFFNGRIPSKCREFQLWDSSFSFGCPNSSLNISDPEERASYFVDEGPFINTKSRVKYTDYSSDYSLLTIFRTGWSIAQYPLGIRKIGDINLSVQLFHISDSGRKIYFDIQNKANLEKWIIEEKKQLKFRIEKLNLVDGRNGFFEVSPRKGSNQTLPIDNENSVSLQAIELKNSTHDKEIPQFFLKPHFNSFEYYLCFSDREFIRFSFEIDFINPGDKKDIELLQQRAKSLISNIISSVNFQTGVFDMS